MQLRHESQGTGPEKVESTQNFMICIERWFNSESAVLRVSPVKSGILEFATEIVPDFCPKVKLEDNMKAMNRVDFIKLNLYGLIILIYE